MTSGANARPGSHAVQERDDTHVTNVLQVARIVGVTDEQKTSMGVGSGLELVTLPHGSQLRKDLLERYESA